MLKQLLIIIFTAAVTFAIVLFLGYIGVEPFTRLTSAFTSWISSFNFSQTLSEIAQNPATLLTLIGTAASIGIPLIMKLFEAKRTAETLKAQAQAKIDEYQDSLNQTSRQLQQTTSSLQSAEQQLSTLQNTNSQLQAQLNTLQQQYEKLQNSYTELQRIRASDVISTLPGGTVIPQPDGSKITIIEKQVIK